MRRNCGGARTAIAALLGVAATLEASGRPDFGTGRVPIRTAGAFTIVPVAVGGGGVYPFLLDTASASTLIDTSLARELALPVTGAATLITSSGPASAEVVQASLRFGATHVDVEALRFPLAAIEAVNGSLRGVLGQDVLRRSNWLLDYGRGVIEQDIDGTLAEHVPGERIAMHWSDDRPSVTAVFDDGPPTRLVLDSAATGLVLFDSHGRRVTGESMRLKSLAEEVRVPVVTAAALSVGSIVFRHPRMAVVPLEVESESGGLLPTAMFDSVYFDNRGDAAVVVPRRRGR